MEANEIDIRGLDKADVLAALYNASRPQGLGWLHARMAGDVLSHEEAAKLVEEHTRHDKAEWRKKCGLPETTIYFDYVYGRVMKVELGGETFNPHLYDRDNGSGAACRALESLLSAPSPARPKEA